MRKFLVIAISIAVNTGSAFAVGSGGYENQVPHARSMGKANLGAASANDASATFYNPALLTSASEEISIGGVYQTLEGDYSGPAGNDSLQQDAAFTPNFHFSNRMETHPFAFGLSVTVPQGLATEWSAEGPLRYVATKSDLAVTAVTPALGIQFPNNISIGIGVDYFIANTAEFERRLSVSNLNFALGGTGGEPDGTQKLSGDGEDAGMVFGFHWAPSELDSVGVSYHAGAHIDIDGDLTLNGLSNESAFVFGGTDYTTKAKSELVIPASLQLGYARKFGTTVVEIGGQWNDWSDFKEQVVSFEETDPTRASVLSAGAVTNKEWKDVWSGGLGVETYAGSVALRAGYAFFDSPVPNSTFEPSTPDSDLHMFSLGIGVPLTESIIVDLAGQYFLLNDRHIDNDVGAADGTTVDGDYEAHAIFGGVNLTYRWGKAKS